MQVRRFLLKALIATTLVVAALAVYVSSMTPAERWLALKGTKAQSYAEAILANDIASQHKYESDFLDYTIISDPKAKTVLFSLHDNGHDLVLIYAPGHSGQFKFEEMNAKRIRNNWYVVQQ